MNIWSTKILFYILYISSKYLFVCLDGGIAFIHNIGDKYNRANIAETNLIFEEIRFKTRNKTNIFIVSKFVIFIIVRWYLGNYITFSRRIFVVVKLAKNRSKLLTKI